MPPKRKRRNSPSPKGLAPGEKLKRAKLPGNASSQWSWVGTEASAVTDITLDHQLLACGLSSRSGNPSCQNKYSQQKQTKDSEALEALEDDVIVISDEDGHPCSPKSCKSNPNCLNHLGQDVWEDEEKMVKTFLKDFDLGKHPKDDERQPGLPVGLKNLGATCYANAFLQVWYRDLPFRRGVYSCKPSGKPSESPIFQLQATFAALQEGIKKVYNPVRLMESLRLRTEEQQDAQEFSKLFISHLDMEFQKQDNPELRKLVAKQFQGTQIYATECQRCGFRSETKSNFLEVELNLKNNCHLEEQLQSYLQAEILTGDNRYLCSKCEELREATRRVELHHLPPVLHFSLLRFVFDVSTLGRKKTKHNITFPLVLDMNKYLTSPDMSGESNIYELRGILLHKGASAYHGHYEAQAIDTESGEWFQFNDEQVTKIPSPGKQIKEKESDAKLKAGNARAKPSGTKKRNDKITKTDHEDEPPRSASSRDAYMLIYVRKDRGGGIDEPLSPPLGVLEDVQAEITAHTTAKALYEEREGHILDWLKSLRQDVMRIYRSWHVQTPKEEDILASQSALNKWLTGLPKSYSLVQVEGDPTTLTFERTDESYSTEEIMCQHNLIDPLKSSNIKRIDKNVYRDMMKSRGWILEPAFTVADICRECVSLQFNERLYEIQHPQLVTKVTQLAEGGSGNDAYWISKSWFKDWKLSHPRMHMAGQGDPSPDALDFLSDVLCEHGGLQVSPNQRTLISCEVKGLLQTVFADWKPPSVKLEVCAICEALEGISKAGRKEERRRAEEEKVESALVAIASHADIQTQSLLRLFYDNFRSHGISEERCFLVNSTFANLWKEWVDNPLQHDRPDEIDNSSLLCQHGNCIVDFSAAVDHQYLTVLAAPVTWTSLTNLYQAKHRIALTVIEQDKDLTTYITDPPLCPDCATYRAFDWTSTTITVVQIAPPGNAPKYQGSTAQGRYNRRLRRTKGVGAKIRLDIEKQTSVKDISIKVQGEWNIPTICQKLIYNGNELKDGAITMEELSMQANGILQLVRLDEVHTIDSELDEIQCKHYEEGHAFAGTLLASSQPEATLSDVSDELQEKEKVCLACTYMNGVGAMACMMCGTMFAEQ